MSYNIFLRILVCYCYLSRFLIKNEHNIHIIAAQTEELDRLRRQISEQSLHNNATNNENLVVLRLRNRQTLEALLEKEKMLQQRDNELERLQEQLEAERNVQQIESMNYISRPLPEHLDEEKLSRKEKELRKRENELEVEMKRWEMERAEAVKPALSEVEEQLKELKIKVSFRDPIMPKRRLVIRPSIRIMKSWQDYLSVNGSLSDSRCSLKAGVILS